MASRGDALGGVTAAALAVGHGGATQSVSRGRTRAGTSDPRAARARELHEQAAEAERQAAQFRAERDRLIRLLRDEDDKRWSYGALAQIIGCSRELIAQVAKRRG